MVVKVCHLSDIICSTHTFSHLRNNFEVFSVTTLIDVSKIDQGFAEYQNFPWDKNK